MTRCESVKNIVYMMVSVIGSIFIGTIMMIAVYCLPIEPIRENVRESVRIYEHEDDWYTYSPGISSTRIDNFTDAIMVNNAAFLGTGDVVADAMNAPFVTYEDLEKQSEYLSRSVQWNTLEGASVVNYARYWHGYLVWLKPLLTLFNISEMRVMNMCVQLVLFLWIFIELYKKNGLKLAIPFAITIISLNPVTTALCMQYSCIYNITLFALLFMLKRNLYNLETYWKMFLWIGISVAFFDFLTYPIVSLGINLIFLIILGEGDMKNNVKKLFYSSFVWGVGYAGMWSGKWLMSYILTGENTIANAVDVAKYRLEGQIGEDPISALEVILYNLHEMFNIPIICVGTIGILYFIIFCVRRGYVFRIQQEKVPALLMVSMFPIIWYLLLKNHSVIHAWMTHRNLSVMILGISCIISYSLLLKKVER